MAEFTEINEFRTALSLIMVHEAFARLGYKRPTLFVPADSVGVACHISRLADVNVSVDESLDSCAWYVEWNGKRVGSEGC